MKGEQLERFLNLCRARGFELRKIEKRTEDELVCQLSVRDFRKLQPILRKTRVHIHILEKNGAPFLLLGARKRKYFLIGLVFAGMVLYWLSGHIWNIHIEGNLKNSTPELLKFLDEQGIIHGIRTKKINCSQIAALLREKYPDITFVAAKVQGTRLLLTISEETLKTDVEKENTPCDIVADIEGEIVKMVVRQGVPMMKKGDTCQVGDILVSGALEIKNDEQETVRTEYVASDADIYIRHELPYYHEFSRIYEKQVVDGKPRDSWYFRMGSWIFGADADLWKNYTTSVEEIPWQITENFQLPVATGKILRTPYKIEKSIYTKEEARELAVRNLKLYEKSLLEKKIEIEDVSLTFSIDENTCILQGKLTIVQCCKKKLAQPVQQQFQ